MNKWEQRLSEALVDACGNRKGQALIREFGSSFPVGYQAECGIDLAVADLIATENLSVHHPVILRFYMGPKGAIHLRFVQARAPVALSDWLTMLEYFGLHVVAGRPYRLSSEKNRTLWIHDFKVEYKQVYFDWQAVSSVFQDVFSAVVRGAAESDGFNRLVLSASMSWREVNVLRAYAKYLHQINCPFSQLAIENTLEKHTTISRQLVEFFNVLHNPTQRAREKHAEALRIAILTALDQVPDLSEDTLLRRFFELIEATLRTNYFQHTPEGENKPYLSFKLDSSRISGLPLPAPLYETFVYSARLEGCHLRFSKIARGGIRWSDRQEDYRTEVLGLTKAQVVKNAVIVPSGAKGGFVLKRAQAMTPQEYRQEGVACYQLFISGLLDLVDNVKLGKRIMPERTVCHDASDPYLVVAADKGTAAFSDVANQLSRQYDFWLSDAFASGGKTGYDHKKMGITARGAWESVKRHFRELEVNVGESEITVVGVGDMSGDVFGNGMLYSKRLQLVAAFDHRHIFIDPTPSMEAAYHERKRLFHKAGSSWAEYNPQLISEGGGVFSRQLKKISITPEMKSALGIQEDKLAPNELIAAVLKAPVDLLFFGGIGTYVKSSQEHQADVGDRANDLCRVDARELRCKVVGEGANLGVTQRGRIEFALTGGLINTDFIDNSGGVDSSDHEVNLKILLNQVVTRGELDEAARNRLLAAQTSEIAELVLRNNYNQALTLSVTAFSAKQDVMRYADYIQVLESRKTINRVVDCLPDEKACSERKLEGMGITRPELATLMAYTKIALKQDILDSDLPDEPYLQQLQGASFPAVICQKYPHYLDEHQLRREIIATQLANRVVNHAGILFVHQMQVETGATVSDIIRAYVIVTEIFSTKSLQNMIESLDFKIPWAQQCDMIRNIRHLIIMSTHWFLQDNRLKSGLVPLIKHYSVAIKPLEKVIPGLMGGTTREYMASLMQSFEDAGLSRVAARRISTYRAMYTALNIIEVTQQCQLDLIKTAQVYFMCGERMNLLWFRDQIGARAQEGYWSFLSRLTLRDQLDEAQRLLTLSIMTTTPQNVSTKKRIDHWMLHNQHFVVRWEYLLGQLNQSKTVEYEMFFIVIYQFIKLIPREI